MKQEEIITRAAIQMEFVISEGQVIAIFCEGKTEAETLTTLMN